MRSQFFLIFCTISTLYFAAAAYSGMAVLRLCHKLSAPWHIFGFWLLWLMMAVMPIAISLGKSYLYLYLKGNQYEWLIITGYYWLAFIYYFTLILLIISGVHFIGKKLLIMGGIVKDPRLFSIFALVLTGLLLAYGTYNAQKPVVRHYDVTIPQKASGLKSLRAVLVADTHLGLVVDNNRLEKMTDMVNSLNPDIIFLAGDIIEDGPRLFKERKMAEPFKKLTPRLGIYGVLGNHEYINGPADENVKCLEDAGIFLLRDTYVKVENSFYIVGRDDISLFRFTGKERLPLADIVRELDRSLPLILLDHQPLHLDEARAEKIDLALSGHTHRGQFFPNNLITGMIFENDWGYLLKGGLHSIVTSGFGTWGPPIRIGNSPEIVSINIIFAN